MSDGRSVAHNGRFLAPTTEVIDRYVAWLRQDREAVGSAIRREVVDETPDYAALSARDQEAWSATVDLALTVLLDGGIDRGEIDDEARNALEAVGRAAADAGVPLEAITGGVNVGARVVRDWPMRTRPAAHLDPDHLRRFSERVTTFANAVNAAILRAYAEQASPQRSGDGGSAGFWRALLRGAFADDASAVAEGVSAGCDLRSAWALVVLPRPASNDVVPALLAVLPDAVAVSRSSPTPHVVVAAPVPSDVTWDHLHSAITKTAHAREAAVLTIGPSGRPHELARGYDRIRPLVRVLDRIALGPGVLRAEDLTDAALLAAIPETTAMDFADHVLGAIDRQPGGRAGRWLRTVEALVQNGGSPKAAAHELGVNVKTVRRHMSDMRKEVGLVFDSFEVLYRVRLALTLRRMSTGLDIVQRGESR